MPGKEHWIHIAICWKGDDSLAMGVYVKLNLDMLSLLMVWEEGSIITVRVLGYKESIGTNDKQIAEERTIWFGNLIKSGLRNVIYPSSLQVLSPNALHTLSGSIPTSSPLLPLQCDCPNQWWGGGSPSIHIRVKAFKADVIMVLYRYSIYINRR